MQVNLGEKNPGGKKCLFFNFRAEIKILSWAEKVTSQAKPKSFSSSYGLSQLGSNSSMITDFFSSMKLKAAATFKASENYHALNYLIHQLSPPDLLNLWRWSVMKICVVM